MQARKSSRRFKVGEISEYISQIFPKTGRIRGPEVGDGAKPDVPTTDQQNEKKKKHRPFYEAVDACARRCLIIIDKNYYYYNFIYLFFEGGGIIFEGSCCSTLREWRLRTVLKPIN